MQSSTLLCKGNAAELFFLKRVALAIGLAGWNVLLAGQFGFPWSQGKAAVTCD
jgi:hypothetical protein